MFKKLLASIGIGGTTVDTKVKNPSVTPGETLYGEVVIMGGQVEQRIEHVDLLLMTEAKEQNDDAVFHSSHTLDVIRVSEAFTIQPRTERRIPFSWIIPLETPINNASLLCSEDAYLPKVVAPVWIHTDLAIAQAVDAKDRDMLDIKPLPQHLAMISALDALGWGLVRVDIEKGYARTQNACSTLGCYQELEFRPTEAQGRLRELELTFIPNAEGWSVLIEADRFLAADSYHHLQMGKNWETVNWKEKLRSLLYS